LAGLARDPSDPIAIHHKHQGTTGEVLDGESPRDSPVALGRRVALRVGERTRAAAVPCARLVSLPHSDKHGEKGWPVGAVKHGGARGRARCWPPSPAAVRGRVRAHRLREGERMIRVSDPLCCFRYLRVVVMNFSRRSRSTAGSASPRVRVRLGQFGGPFVGPWADFRLGRRLRVAARALRAVLGRCRCWAELPRARCGPR